MLLLFGLRRLSGVGGSLLLNLEGPFTVLVGITVFGEHLGRRAAVAVAAVFAGALLMTALPGGLGRLDALGALLVASACAAWAVDNNLTQALTLRDPFVIVSVKTGVAALVNLPLAAARGVPWPSPIVLLGALAVGAVAYGLSVLADAYALRLLGAAREAAVFATAPFAGALVAVVVLGDRLNLGEWLGGAAMVAGAIGLLSDRHSHLHRHEPLRHDHRHSHDGHHGHHGNDTDRGVGEHAHDHAHQPQAHRHAHVSDVHHRHRARPEGQ